MVVFRSTTPCVRFSSPRRSNFFTLNSIPISSAGTFTYQTVRRLLYPVLIKSIKTVVVAVAVETRISAQAVRKPRTVER